MIGVRTKMDINTTVTRFRPEENQVELNNGKTYTYKALVIATGLDQDYSGVEGLEELDKKSNDNGVTVHLLDTPTRIPNNHWHGYHHPRGDFIVYHPGFPYRGEGEHNGVNIRWRFLCFLLRASTQTISDRGVFNSWCSDCSDDSKWQDLQFRLCKWICPRRVRKA